MSSLTFSGMVLLCNNFIFLLCLTPDDFTCQAGEAPEKVYSKGLIYENGNVKKQSWKSDFIILTSGTVTVYYSLSYSQCIVNNSYTYSSCIRN